MGLHKQPSSDSSITNIKKSHQYHHEHPPQDQKKSTKSRLPSAQSLHFDIDKYLNRIVIQNQCRRLPAPISRWFGVRSEPAKEPGNLLIAFWACVGAFLGLMVVGAIFKYAPGVADLNPPVIFASLGATAILEYNTIQSPLAQPRASIVGHVSASIIGVAIAKLFMYTGPNFDELRWIAGAVSCGIASATMTLTNTVHPPGGATAVLAIITPDIVALGWYFPPLILMGSVLMIAVGLIVNNIQRQFPQFWWTPKEVKRVKKVPVDEEATPSEAGSDHTHVDDIFSSLQEGPVGVQVNKSGDAQLIVIGPHGLVLPEGFTLGPEEKGVVQILQERLRDEFANRVSSSGERPASASSAGNEKAPSESGSDGSHGTLS